MKIKNLKLKVLFPALLLPQLVGFSSSYFTIGGVREWYPTLNKPWFNPPSFVFAPVWTILYLLMGVSLYLLWTAKKTKAKSLALKLFAAQLAANWAWSLLFFGLRSPLFGLFEILVLFTLILATIKVGWRVNKWAAYLLIPYVAWVTFATVLNGAIVWVNP